MIERRLEAIVLVSALSSIAGGCNSKNASEDEEKAVASSQVEPAQTPQPDAKAMTPVRLPGDLVPAPWLDEATMVVALGDKESAMIVAAGVGWLRWFSASGVPLGERLGPGAPQVLRTQDLDGDGESEVIFARGAGRDAADAERVLEVLRIRGHDAKADIVVLPDTTRQQVAGVAKAAGGKQALWVASFADKYHVEVGLYEKSSEGWTKSEDRGKHRVVSDIEVLDSGVPAIARMYGDSAGVPGGVYELPVGKPPQPVPSTRGARALAVLPGTGRLVMADGWHKNYGRKAQGLVTVVERKPRGWTKISGVEVAENYGFSQLRIGDVHREEGPEIIASGNGPAVVILPARPELLYVLGDAVATDAVPVNLYGDERAEVVIAGPKPMIWSPR